MLGIIYTIYDDIQTSISDWIVKKKTNLIFFS